MAEEKNMQEVYGRALIRLAIRDEAIRQGAINPEDVLVLINRTGITIDLESEVVLGAEAAIIDLRIRMPFLFSPPEPARPYPTDVNTKPRGWQ